MPLVQVSRHEVGLIARALVGTPYVLGGRGMEIWTPVRPKPSPFLVLDCSGNIGYCIKAAGGMDLRWTHNAAAYFSELPMIPESKARPMDVCIYGMPNHPDHIMWWVGDGRVLGSCGAGHENDSIASAVTNQAAGRNDGKAQYRSKPDYRQDLLGFFSMDRYLL